MSVLYFCLNSPENLFYEYYSRVHICSYSFTFFEICTLWHYKISFFALLNTFFFGLNPTLYNIQIFLENNFICFWGGRGRRKWQPTLVFLPRESWGERSLVGCRLWRHTVRHDWSDLACMHALEKEMATHSSVLAWRSPGTEKPSELSSVGSHRVGHDWSDLAAAAGEE